MFQDDLPRLHAILIPGEWHDVTDPRVEPSPELGEPVLVFTTRATSQIPSDEMGVPLSKIIAYRWRLI